MCNIVKKILLIVIILILNIPLYSEAFTFDDIINNGNSFINAGDSNLTITPKESKLKSLSKYVSNILLTIAVGVTLISAFIMALNFTFQSIEDKAKIKESMLPWIIGIIISFGAYGIWNITMNVFYTII